MHALTGANLVVLANNFNPSIVSKDWLIDKGIINAPVSNFAHTPVFSLVETEEMSLVVDGQRLQIAIRKVEASALNRLADIGGKFVRALPETPYNALGFNEIYSIPEGECNLKNIMRPNEEKLQQLLSSGYKVGSKFVFKFQDFIVTADISPSSEKENVIHAAFNFHSRALGISEIERLLALSATISSKSVAIIKGLMD